MSLPSMSLSSTSLASTSFDLALGACVTAGLLAYLAYALLRPERF